MSQRLHAGDDFDPEHIRIIVYFTQPLGGISAAHTTEIGVLRDLVCIFGIKHKRIVAHCRKNADHFLGSVHIEHGIARNVSHIAKHIVLTCLNVLTSLGNNRAEQ